MAKLYEPAAWIAFVLFVLLGGLHVAAVFRIIAPPVFLAFATFPIVFFCQIVLIAGFNGGPLRRDGAPLLASQRFSSGSVALRWIPRGWKLFGLPFWYLYMPAMFLTRVVGMSGRVTERGGQLLLTNRGEVIRSLTAEEAFAIRADEFSAASLILTGFAFAHFICLRYVIPNRTKILAEVAGE